MNAAYTRHEDLPLAAADQSGKRVVRRRESRRARAHVVVDLLSGRSPRRGVSFEVGTPSPPLTVGSLGAWCVDARDIAPMHAAIAWNGESLFVAALSDASVSVEGRGIRGRQWVELLPGRLVELGGARLYVTRREPFPDEGRTDPMCTVPLPPPPSACAPPRASRPATPAPAPPSAPAVAPTAAPTRTLAPARGLAAAPTFVRVSASRPVRSDALRTTWSSLPRVSRLAALVSAPALLLACMFFAYAMSHALHERRDPTNAERAAQPAAQM